MSSIFKDSPETFINNIYNELLGQLRLEILIEDLEAIMSRNTWISTILDIGCGHGVLALNLLEKHVHLRGHLVDPSPALIGRAQEDQAKRGIPATRVSAGIGDLSCILRNWEVYNSDLIICHAVANWVDNPSAFIDKLANLAIKTGACVSLVFGTSLGKALRFATQGNLKDAVTAAMFPGCPVTSLLGSEKVRPLDAEAVLRRVKRSDCRVVLKSAVRIFSDLLPKDVREATSIERLRQIDGDLKFRSKYWNLGQLVHFVFQSNKVSGPRRVLGYRSEKSYRTKVFLPQKDIQREIFEYIIRPKGAEPS